MQQLTPAVVKSELWRTSLAEIDHDQYKAERERLRSSFIGFRDRAAQLAVEIGHDLPDLTIHDVTHLDALWEVASQITGTHYSITPSEGYVLGGAILLHDLAMSLAATPGGYEALKASEQWRDLAFSAYATIGIRSPSSDQIKNPDTTIKGRIVFELLRQLHAENAEKLPFRSFGKNGSVPQYLIEDTELRQTFGQVIGQIAHSHWWSIAKVEHEFAKTIGAPHWAPSTWTIDPLKIACILRAADAGHVDARRAPMFRRAFANIGAGSIDHWTFQERINKAYVADDALVYTSGLPFSLNDASAWWLCLDTLRMIDKELRQIDTLLSERTLPRFAAKRVAGVDTPERMAKYIRTVDWHPINATIQVSDLPNLIRSLGGEELYGKRPLVPLRELIQNASDAVRARRYIEKRGPEFAEIKIELIEKGEDHVLRVEDNGVGMSRRVLTEFLLDFGNSFWTKPQAQEEFPGLLSSGFQATGRYGIGFFSVFMAADKVTVVTRRPDAASADTLVLEFGSGLAGRPILRPANKSEQLRDGGTVVSLQLKVAPTVKDGLLYKAGSEGPRRLVDVCREIAPALDVRLTVIGSDASVSICEPSDWRTVDGMELLARIEGNNRHRAGPKQTWMELLASNLRTLTTCDGTVVGRAAICPIPVGLRGALVVGGFATSPLSGVVGLMLGESTTAARDRARPMVSAALLRTWATEQAKLVADVFDDHTALYSAAETVCLCDAHTGPLPIAMHCGRWKTYEQIRNCKPPDAIVMVDNFVLNSELKHEEVFTAEDNVFFTRLSGVGVLFQPAQAGGGAPLTGAKGFARNVSGAVLQAIAEAWGIDETVLSRRVALTSLQPLRIGTAAHGRVITTSALLVRNPHIAVQL